MIADSNLLFASLHNYERFWYKPCNFFTTRHTKRAISMWRPRGCQPQDFSFCVNAMKFGTNVEKWCFYSLFYKRVCMWNKNCVRAFQFFLQKCDFRNRWKTGHTPMIVEQTVLHPMKNMCTKFQVNLFVTSRDILTSALHMSKNALLRKSRKKRHG